MISLLLSLALYSPAPQSSPSNVLVIMADDLSIDVLNLYRPLCNQVGPTAILLGGGGNPINASCTNPVAPLSPTATTPAIDSLAATGIVFDRVWSNPTCSPTRATLQTGRYASRTGIGKPLSIGTSDELQACETTIAELLDGVYECGLFGKWHLGLTPCDPCCQHGWDRFRGHLHEVPGMQLCSTWQQDVCDRASDCGETPTCGPNPETTYLLDKTFDDAKTWIGEQVTAQSGPWLCYLWPQFPYDIFHEKTSTTCTACMSGNQTCYLQALENLDAQIASMITFLSMQGELANTTIIFLGDNGTPGAGASNWPPGDDPFTAGQQTNYPHAKGTLYNGGVHVPMIVSGPGVGGDIVGTRSKALINTTDLFATIASIAGVTIPAGVAEDSVDFSPLFVGNSDLYAARPVIFAEEFNPNQVLACGPVTPNCAVQNNNDHSGAVRNGRFKLIRSRLNGACVEEFFDLNLDFAEQNDLLTPGGFGGLTAFQQTKYTALATQLDAWVLPCGCGGD